MTDPYERSKVPDAPEKLKLFSPWRPFKIILLIWLGGLVFMLSLDAWSDSSDFFFVPMIVTALYLSPAVVPVAIYFGLWSILAGLGLWLFYLFLFLALRLDEDEVIDYWVERLKPK